MYKRPCSAVISLMLRQIYLKPRVAGSARIFFSISEFSVQEALQCSDFFDVEKEMPSDKSGQ